MKKLITLLLILALLLPAAVYADDLSGCWAFWMPNSASFGSGNYAVVIILNENGEMALLYTIPDKNGLQELSTTGTWESTENSVTLYAEGDKQNAVVFEYKNGMIWFANGAMNVGLKKVEYTADQLEYRQQ